jgi:2-polyprenyl-3-methyl-5-hydroxy-6-metoxy-1,4-benzoquinol methylase
MKTPDEARIIESWNGNTGAWTAAVREGKIASRVAVTDGAIVDAVLSRSPRRALDIGCGEGWLSRALNERGIVVVGIDAVQSLVDAARLAGGGDFRRIPYESLAGELSGETFDLAVCNFSLIGKESVEAVFDAVPRILSPGGFFIVQTLHPLAACGDLPYIEGWREGSWAGFGPEFADPAPWYFRTIGDWVALFAGSGLAIREMREPTLAQTGRPASLLLIAGLPLPP